MSYQTITTRSNRPVLSTAASALMVMAFAIAPLANAHETAKTEIKTMPAAPMDHSKMTGMKDMQGMQGMKHSGGTKHTEGMSMTGDVDYDFAVNMRMHHQMAVEMSQAQLKNGKSPKLRALATSIIAAQKKEIATLNAWLSTAKKPASK